MLRTSLRIGGLLCVLAVLGAVLWFDERRRPDDAGPASGTLEGAIAPAPAAPASAGPVPARASAVGSPPSSRPPTAAPLVPPSALPPLVATQPHHPRAVRGPLVQPPPPRSAKPWPKATRPTERRARAEGFVRANFAEFNPLQSPTAALTSLTEALRGWAASPGSHALRNRAAVALSNAAAAMRSEHSGAGPAWRRLSAEVGRALRAQRPSGLGALVRREVPALTAYRPPAPPPTRTRPVSAGDTQAAAPALDAVVPADAPPTPADLAPTVIEPAAVAALDAEIARLGPEPLALFRSVHDHVFPEVYRGARFGPAATLARRRGNDLDSAWLLLELLRRAGVPARLTLDRLALSPDQAMSLTDTRDAGMAARVLRSAGVEATAQAPAGGAAVTAVHALHWQVRAWLPAANAPGFSEPRWVYFAPLLKEVARTRNGAEGAPPGPLTPEVLYSAESPLTRWETALRPAAPTRRTIRPWSGPFLPQASPAPVLAPVGVTRAVPPGELHRLTIELAGRVALETDTVGLDRHVLTVTTEPATPADAARIAAHGNLGDTPAVDLGLSLSLRLDDAERARTATGAAGDPALLVVRITTPAYGTEAETFPLARGGRYHIAISAGPAGSREVDAGAEPLVELAARFYTEIGRAAERIFDAYGAGHFQDVHVGVVGFEPVVDRVAGLAVRVRPQLLLFDMPRLITTPYGRAGQAPSPRDVMRPAGELDPLGIHEGPLAPLVDAMRLFGHETSFLEATVPGTLYSGVGYSAQQVLARADELGARVYEETDVLLRHHLLAGDITAPEAMRAELFTAAENEEVVRVPAAPLPSPADALLPPLTGFTSYDPFTGAGRYILSPAFHGGLFDLGLETGRGDTDVRALFEGTSDSHRRGPQGTMAAGGLNITLTTPASARCAPGDEVRALGLALPGGTPGDADGYCVFDIERLREDGTPGHGERVGAACVPGNPGDPLPPPCEIDLWPRYSVAVLLDEVPVFQTLIDTGEVYDAGPQAWMDRLRPAPEDTPRIAPDGMLGELTDFDFSPDGRRLSFAYRLPGEGRLPETGRLSVAVTPVAEDGDVAACTWSQRRTGTYRVLHDAATAAPAGHLGDDAHVQSDTLTARARLGDLGLDFAVPTPGGPLGLDVVLRGDAGGGLGALGPWFRHLWEARVVSGSGNTAAVIFGDGSGVTWRATLDAERAYAPTEQGERGRLRAITYPQPPLSLPLASVPADPDADGCVSPLPGWEYTAVDGTRYVFARSESRDVPDRRQALPTQVDVARLSSVRDARDNGFDLVYADTPDGLRLDEVRAMSGARPRGAALRFEYADQAVSVPGMPADLEITRLSRVTLRRAAAPPEPPPPPAAAPVCASAATSPVSDAWEVLGDVSFGYDAERLTELSVTRRGDDGQGEWRRFQFEWADQGAEPAVARIVTPSNEAFVLTPRFLAGQPFTPVSSPALIDRAQPFDPFCGRGQAPERPGRPTTLAGRGRIEVARVDRPDRTWRNFTRHGAVSRLAACSAEDVAGDLSTVEVEDSAGGRWQEGHDDTGRLRVRSGSSERVANLDEVIAHGATPGTVAVDRHERWSWLLPLDEPAAHSVGDARSQSCLGEAALCVRDAAPSPLCVDAFARLGDDTDVIVRRRHGLPGEPALVDAPAAAAGGETWTFRERVGLRDGLFAERETRRFVVTSDGPVLREHLVHAGAHPALLDRIEGPGEDFTAFTARDPATGLPTEISTPDEVLQRRIDARTGLTLRETLPSGRFTETQYDAWGRPRAQTTLEGGLIEWTRVAGERGGWRVTETRTPRAGAGEATSVVTETDALDRPWRVSIPSGVRGLVETIVRNYEGDDWMLETRTRLDGDLAECGVGLRTEVTQRLRDERGRIFASLDRADGRQSSLEFDARGRAVVAAEFFQDDDAPPVTTRFGYDLLDRRVTTTHADAYVEVARFDAGGHEHETLIGGGVEAGLVSRSQFDALGRRVAHKPMRAGETRSSWDAQDRLSQVEAPEGQVERVEYTGASRRPTLRTQTWNGVRVETELPTWDPDGRPLSRMRTLVRDVAPDLSLPEQWQYPGPGVTSHTAGQGAEAITTTEVDDGLGRVLEVTRGDLRERYGYDALDQTRTTRTGALREQTRVVDALGRLVFETTRDGLVRVVAHTGESAQTEALCDDGAHPTTVHHRATDALGRPRLECNSAPPGLDAPSAPPAELPPGRIAPPSPPPGFAGVCRSLTWSAEAAAARTTLSVVDADGHQTELRVDAAGEVTSTTDRARAAAPAVLDLETDAGGVTTRRATDPLGREITEIRDALGRPRSVTVQGRPELDERYNHQGVVVTRLTGPEGAPARQETHVVDADGRTHSTRVAYAGETPATWRTHYDSLGRPAAATDPDGIESGWSYDAAGRLASARIGRDVTSFAYLPGTAIETRVVPPVGEAALLVPDPDTGRILSRAERGVTTHFEWDTRGRLEVERTGARSEQRWTYAGDHLVSRATGGDAATLRYDAAGRVVGLSGPGGYAMRYERDAAGRITAWRVGDRLLRGAEYDALDRLDAEYDAAGNRVEYVYDDESLTLLQDRIWAEATAGLTRVGVTRRDTQGRPTQWVEERVGGAPVTVNHDRDDVARTESYSRGVAMASLRRYTPGGRLASTQLRDGPTVTVAERDDHGRPRVVDHGGVPVTISWAPDDQPTRVDVGGGLGVTACYAYHPDRRLRVVRWIQGLGAGERCPEPPGDLCAGAVAVYATDAFGDDGTAREVRQCVAGSARTDTLAYDTRGRLTAWRTAASGPLGDDADETAHFRRYDALDQVTSEDAARWPLGRNDFPDDDGALPGRAPLDRTAERSFERVHSDGVVERVRDRVSAQVVELTPDAAGRSTTHTERFRTLDLSRDAQGRPARDAYDAEGRRLGTALQGEALVYDAYGLVEHTRAGATRVFAPPLPGVQLSRRADGQWEAALLTPTQTPLAVVGNGGASRLQALYSPSGEATEARPANDIWPYPKTWSGYLRYPDRGQFGETAGLYDAGARLYAPTWGQFLEGDAVLPEADVPETWGRYAYGGGDTVGRWDPDGRFAWLPVLAALAYWSANTAVDVTVDAAIAGATGDQDFSYGRSIFVNGFINAVTGGLGGKALVLAKVGRGARFMSDALLEASVTTAADAIAARVNGEDYDFVRGAAGNFLGSAVGRTARDLLHAGGRRILGGRRPTMRDAPSPHTPHGEDAGAVASNAVGVDAEALGRQSPERIFEEPVGVVGRVQASMGAPDPVSGRGYGVNDPPVRIDGAWTVNDMKQALLGHPPRGLGSPDLHHAEQMPGSGIHELVPDVHRGSRALHPNDFNQGVTPEMRTRDRQLHWWYRAREKGADDVLPTWIYDD